MSFKTWAKLFEEHAASGEIPEASWVSLAKTNLAGKARERWLAAEEHLSAPVTWESFCSTLKPMFADADKHANAVKAWNNLRPCTSLDLTAIREDGRQLVTLFSEMGPDPAQKPITEKGAIDFYITGLPEAARGVIAMDRMANAAKYERLDSAVTQAAVAIQGAYP